MFSIMFHRLMWTNFVYYILDIRLYLSLSVNLTSHFSNFADLDNCRYQTHQRNIMKFYLIILKHLIIQLTKLQLDILNFKYHFSTLQKQFRLLLNKGVPEGALFDTRKQQTGATLWNFLTKLSSSKYIYNVYFWQISMSCVFSNNSAK